MKKELAIIGLGKMGSNMARRMMEKGWRVVGYDRSTTVVANLKTEGMEGVDSYAEIATALSPQRIAWLLVPAGNPVDDVLFGPGGLAEKFSAGDVIIDGGNSFYKDAAKRAERLLEKGIHFIDVGTSGGPAGARNGACLMIGGDRKAFESTEELYKDFAADDSYRFFDGHGAGHFVKMIHNGIEYGMMQALAEGFEVLKKSEYGIDLSLAAEIYNKGSVIESRLVGWLGKAFKERGPELEGVSATVNHTGEGEWTVKAAKEMGVEVKVIEDSFQFRVDSAKKPSYTGKAVSALREQFGGHDVKEK